MEALIAAMMAAGPAANRPPQSALVPEDVGALDLFWLSSDIGVFLILGYFEQSYVKQRFS
jgi:hypothetical protein